MSNVLTRENQMGFHEKLFKNKGWLPDQEITKVCLLTLLRSDMVNKPTYCKSFYNDIVLILDKLGFQRGAGSCDLDESGASMVIQRPESEMAITVNNLVKSAKGPVVFFHESSPISEYNMEEYSAHITKLCGLEEYLVISYDPWTKVVLVNMFSKGKVKSALTFKNQPNFVIKEVPKCKN
jgi:virulence-associated protein VapD